MESKPTFSVVCVYNDREILQEYTLRGLSKQNGNLYELILINNTDDQYTSAAEALNEGADRAKGHYYMFLHQDVFLLSDNCLSDAAEYLETLKDVGVAGLAGMSTSTQSPFDRGRNRIYHGPEKNPWSAAKEISNPVPVQTIDEFCIIVPSKVFAVEKFDPSLCDGWHLYAVEYCLRVRNKLEHKVYVLPIDVWHGSTGMVVENSYYRTLLRITERYENVPCIHTTVGSWPNNRWYLITLMGLFLLINRVLPNKYAQIAKNWWPLIWGGAIPAFFDHGFSALPELMTRFRKRFQ